MLCNEFDPERRAIINPEDICRPVEGFPEICVGIFSNEITRSILEAYGGEVISQCKSCTGTVPIYKVKAFDAEVALFMPSVGGPAAVAFIEEVIPQGGRYFVFCGAAGVLDRDIAHGKLLLPTAAIRDEGVSYHYLPPTDEVELNPATVACCRKALTDLGYPFAEGKTWTTDAFYRETRTKLLRRREQGCISVEMECASLAAVAQFRGAAFAEFFYATDTLDGDSWDSGILGQRGGGLEEVCFRAAVETGKNMASKK